MTVETVDSDGCESTGKAQSTIEALFELASRGRFFRSLDGRFHAQVPVEDRLEIHGLKTAAFRAWLIERHREVYGEPPGLAPVRSVISALEARARFDRGLRSVHVRVGREGDSPSGDFYIDLGDESGRAVKVNAHGWIVIDKPKVKFWRPDGMLALPCPSRGGSIEALRPFVNLTDKDFRLLVAWLAAAMLPEGPYPILAISGEQGSGKSMLARTVRLCVDPQAPALLAPPNSTSDLMLTAFHSWLVVYDNISAVPPWLSDSFCRLSTGGGISKRRLFSNDERSLIDAERAIILSGIGRYVKRDDLADRCVFLELPAITDAGRRSQSQFSQSLKEQLPTIFGGLLDAVAGGLRGLPSIEFSRLPRMADFGRFGEAVGRALGWPDDTFLSLYRENRREAARESLEESIVALVLLNTAELDGFREEWKSSPSEMLAELRAEVPRSVLKSPQWPKNSQRFGIELRRIAPLLRTHGIIVTFGRSETERYISIRKEAV